jgi:2-hydroxy-3-keto-5-methylthiopentenyl-1-phosphate phosphatase
VDSIKEIEMNENSVSMTMISKEQHPHIWELFEEMKGKTELDQVALPVAEAHVTIAELTIKNTPPEAISQIDSNEKVTEYLEEKPAASVVMKVLDAFDDAFNNGGVTGWKTE